jgi:hypothetical protein
MRIINKGSTKNDYYDITQQYGHDSNLVYLREEKEIEDTSELIYQMKKKYYYALSFWSDYYKNISIVDVYIIGFCGKLYPVFEINIEDWSKRSDKGDFPIKTTYICYDFDTIYNLFKPYFKKNDEKAFLGQKYHYNKHQQSTNKTFKGLFNKFIEKDNCIDLFFKYKVPIFFINFYPIYRYSVLYKIPKETKITLNCNLKQFEFYKVFNPYQAYQEISMYISGVLGVGAPEIIEISDKNKITKKGFDTVSSFRTKSPGKKRKRRKG